MVGYAPDCGASAPRSIPGKLVFFLIFTKATSRDLSNMYSCFQQHNQIRAKIVVFSAVQMRIMWQLGKNSILALQMTIYRARIEFLPSYHIIYKNKNNIHDRFVSAQPHSLQLSGGKNDLFSPSSLCGLGRKSHFCLPRAEVNSVVPRQNGRECYILREICTQ